MVTSSHATDQTAGDRGHSVPPASAAFTAPLGSVRGGRLIFASGAAQVRLGGGAAPAALYAAHFEEQIPGVTVRDAIVTIEYGRGRSLGQEAGRPRRGVPSEVLLNESIPWEIEFRGGVSGLAARLENIRLRSLDLGNVSRTHIRLPRPAGVVYLHIGGNASGVTIVRPAEIAVQFMLHGSGAGLVFDGQHLGTTDDGLRWRSNGYLEQAPRYEITVSGSASRFIVGTE